MNFWQRNAKAFFIMGLLLSAGYCLGGSIGLGIALLVVAAIQML